MWKKIQIFFRFNWLKILLGCLGALILFGIIYYTITGTRDYHALDEFYRRQLSGQMAAQMPMMMIVYLVGTCVFIAFYWWMFRGGGMGSISAKKINESKMDVSWDEVIGMESAKKEALEIVKLLKDRSAVNAVGGRIVKGTMMIGPPGCGKTYLAKAMATECGLPMISAVGSEFVAMFMGQGAARMKSLFKQARKIAKIEGGCIIFIDEIDAFAQPRQTEKGFGGTTSTNATINQFLTELDGMRHRENNIIVIAATNAEEEDLDPAIMRSGRFDRKIYIDKPSHKEREELIRFYLSKVDADPDINIEDFAEKSKYFSPSDINNMVREAGIIAMRHQRTTINTEDMTIALDRVIASVEKMGGEKKILSNKVNVKWDDVIGMTDAKEEAWEIVKLLKDRNLLKATGGKIVKGVVMFGPPGCGKTYLAKAMATESGFPFISISGSELVGTLVGEGQKRMSGIFEEARKVARAEGGCIIFFDEIDSFARHRVGVTGWGGGISHNATINQFLTELDGLRQTENNIIVLAATNASESELDSAILRSGRLERKIHVQKPNIDERREIFNFYFKKVSIHPKVDVNHWAQIAVGFSPSQIDNMIREAGLISLRANREVIKNTDLHEAYNRIIMGSLTRRKFNRKSVMKTAYHEAGHAIMTYLAHPTEEVYIATIRARGGALGFIDSRNIEHLESTSPSREHWLAVIQVLLAGYVAEKVALGTTASGVGGGPGSDFNRAMRIAHYMVWCLGMGQSKLIGDFTAISPRAISEKTKETLDHDVQEILQSCLQRTTQLLTQHRDVLEFFKDVLIDKQEIYKDEIQAIFDKFNLVPATKDNDDDRFEFKEFNPDDDDDDIPSSTHA